MNSVLLVVGLLASILSLLLAGKERNTPALAIIGTFILCLALGATTPGTALTALVIFMITVGVIALASTLLRRAKRSTWAVSFVPLVALAVAFNVQSTAKQDAVVASSIVALNGEKVSVASYDNSDTGASKSEPLIGSATINDTFARATIGCGGPLKSFKYLKDCVESKSPTAQKAYTGFVDKYHEQLGYKWSNVDHFIKLEKEGYDFRAIAALNTSLSETDIRDQMAPIIGNDQVAKDVPFARLNGGLLNTTEGAGAQPKLWLNDGSLVDVVLVAPSKMQTVASTGSKTYAADRSRLKSGQFIMAHCSNVAPGITAPRPSKSSPTPVQSQPHGGDTEKPSPTPTKPTASETPTPPKETPSTPPASTPPAESSPPPSSEPPTSEPPTSEPPTSEPPTSEPPSTPPPSSTPPETCTPKDDEDTSCNPKGDTKDDEGTSHDNPSPTGSPETEYEEPTQADPSSTPGSADNSGEVTDPEASQEPSREAIPSPEESAGEPSVAPSTDVDPDAMQTVALVEDNPTDSSPVSLAMLVLFGLGSMMFLFRKSIRISRRH